MIIKFTRVIYEEDEISIPLRELEEIYDGDIEEAIREKDTTSYNSNIIETAYEDIEKGEIDEDDKAYLRRIDDEEKEARNILYRQYLNGLF